MNNRTELILAISSGDINRIQALRVKGNPVFISPCKGKYYKRIDKVEISLTEIKELKKKHEVVFLIEIETSDTDVSFSEQEIKDREGL